MALALTLAEAGQQPERLQVTAVCTLEEVAEKPRITHMDLEVRGKVPGREYANRWPLGQLHAWLRGGVHAHGCFAPRNVYERQVMSGFRERAALKRRIL